MAFLFNVYLPPSHLDKMEKNPALKGEQKVAVESASAISHLLFQDFLFWFGLLFVLVVFCFIFCFFVEIQIESSTLTVS